MAVIVYYGEFARFCDCENWIASALDRAGHCCVRVQHHQKQNAIRAIDEAVGRHQASVLLLSKCPYLSAADLRRIKYTYPSLTLAYWTFDWMAHPDVAEWYFPQAKECHVCFQTDGFDRDQVYWNAGIDRVELHQAIEPTIHKPLDFIPPQAVLKYQADIAFAASLYTKGRRDLHKILFDYSVANDLTYKHWGKPDPEVWLKDFAAMCALSKVVIGSNFVNDVPGYWSDRAYLTLGCQGFFLTQYVEGQELVFKDGEDLAYWRDYPELVEKLDYYLPREAERKAIATNGKTLVHNLHTYDHRVQVFWEEISRCRNLLCKPGP